MEFRFKDSSGTVVHLPDVTSLIRAIRNGQVKPETPFAIGDDKYWHRAETVAAYREAEQVLRRLPAGHALLGSAPLSPPPAAKPAKSGVGSGAMARKAVMGLVLLVVAGLVLLRTLTPSHASTGEAEKAGGPTPLEQRRLELEKSYGNALARNIRWRQDWLQDQRLDQHFSGEALKSPSVLRSVYSVSRGMRQGADSLLPRADVQQRRMVNRADSLEGSVKRLAGLSPAVQDALLSWRDDLKTYIRIQYDLAATLDAMAGYLLSHQQGFAIENERPFFMSRADGSEYRELLDELRIHTNRERAWSEEMDQRHPGWLTGLSPNDLPRFGDPLLIRTR